MKIIVFLFSVAVILDITSCRKSHTWSLPAYYADTVGPAVVIDSFPLQVGNRWVYSDINGEQVATVAGDTVISGIRCSKVLLEGAGKSPATEYVYNTADGLHEVAYDIDMSSSNDYTGNFLFNSYSMGPYRQFTPAIYTARFPARSGDKWSTSEYPTAERIWMGHFVVTNKAGTFNCVKLAQLTGGQDGMTYYYYSTKGLVRIVYVFYNDMGSPGTITRVKDLISINL